MRKLITGFKFLCPIYSTFPVVWPWIHFHSFRIQLILKLTSRAGPPCGTTSIKKPQFRTKQIGPPQQANTIHGEWTIFCIYSSNPLFPAFSRINGNKTENPLPVVVVDGSKEVFFNFCKRMAKPQYDVQFISFHPTRYNLICFIFIVFICTLGMAFGPTDPVPTRRCAAAW